ncbi:MAG: hypothetical protein M0C28_03630 [Candidatus Moduliflexus flocculans]|nr:hypothetical protein [Candidatus Moduliflexus flocculans]
MASARPVYYFNAGLHSTELGSPEMVMEMAYRLAVSDQPMIQKIRGELIVLINPVSEPDGRDKQVDWFYRYLKGKTDFDALPPVSPPYWGFYVFHDNNRDSHQEALQLSKAVSRMFFEYHPQVVHDLHESLPLLQTWNGTGPFNTNLDPILLNEWFAMSFAELSALTSAGMPGVWTWGFSDGWEHCFLDSIGVNHNSIGRGYETFGNGTAETVERVLRPNEERYAGRPATSQEWYRPMPPPRKFMWSLRNNTNYMESGCLAALDYAAKHAKEMLRDFYRKGYNSWQKGVKGGPYAFAIAGGPGRPAARGRHGRPPHRPRHRGGEGDRAVQGRGRGVRGGDVRGPARSAVPRLRRRPAHAADLPDRRRLRSLRRRVVGADGALRARGQAHRRRQDHGRGGGLARAGRRRASRRRGR